jgi:hypothetical protein
MTRLILVTGFLAIGFSGFSQLDTAQYRKNAENIDRLDAAEDYPALLLALQ